MPETRFWIAVAASTVPLAFAVATLATSLPDFWDPCHEWGHDGGAISPGDGCDRVTATTETRGEVALRLALIQGTVLVACGVGLAGAWFDRRVPTAAAAVLLTLVTVPLLLGFGFAFVLPGAVGFWVATAWPTSPPKVEPPPPPMGPV